MPGPHPPEFRHRAVELARELDEDGNRRYPVAQLARDLNRESPPTPASRSRTVMACMTASSCRGIVELCRHVKAEAEALV